ncbi:hypothetical protein ACIBQ5_24975 [Streptomyces massasporeus]|nr:hypothetical protein [Streptomyces sp. AK010]MBB6415442.1 hypothetical protein [Streptomyces sp. AK010]
MDWWLWVVIALAVVALCAVSLLGVQARRRGGGVIAGGEHHPHGRKKPGP